MLHKYEIVWTSDISPQLITIGHASPFNTSMMNTEKKVVSGLPVWVPAYMLGVTLAIPMTLQIVHHVLAIQRNRDEGHILHPKYQPQVQ